MTQTATPTVSYEVYLRERDRRIKAEQERDALKDELFLLRKLRRAPVLKPVAKEVLEEFRHVEKWGKVRAPDGSTRANFTTIANHLHVSPDTVARQAERLEKLGLVEIHEHQGPQDEQDRKYVHVKEEKLSAIDQLADPDNVFPKQGGNRYQCQNPGCLSNHVKIKRKTTLVCLDCQHESILSETEQVLGAEKQVAFQRSKHTQEQASNPSAQLAEQCVYTPGYDEVPAPEKQVAFEELKALKIWCPHRAKVPYQIRGRNPQKAKPNDAATWSTYEDALSVYQDSQTWKYPYDGVGIMNNGNYTFIDKDKCRDKDTGDITDDACEVLARFPTYWEISMSGTGLHGIARGSIPAGVHETGVIELYPETRFFVWTGEQLPGTENTIEDCEKELNELYAELRPSRECTEQAPSPVKQFYNASHRSDAEILEKARNGKKGAMVRMLYDEGRWEKAGYRSQSHADLALCNELGYWADKDVSAVDRLFRDSNLMRDKWDRSAGRGETYGERTIRKATEGSERIAS